MIIRKKKRGNEIMDYTTKRFLNLVEEELKEKGLWLPQEEKLQVASKAAYLFVAEDYSTEENAVHDVICSNDCKMKNFQLKITFTDGLLKIDYLDGSDVEVSQVNSSEEILNLVENAILETINNIDEI